MIKGKVEAISVSNEDVEIYVMDEDNVSQDIRIDVETLRGELLNKNEDVAIFNAEELENFCIHYHIKSRQPLMDLMYKCLP